MTSDLAVRRKMITEQFCDRVAEQPGRTALFLGDEELSYGDLDQWSDRVAAALAARGVAAGEVVALAGALGFERVALVLGVLKAGAVLVPLSMDDSETRRAEVIGRAGAAVLLTDSTSAGAIRAPIPVVTGSRDEAGALRAGVAAVDDLGFVYFTSGTTGAPKGIDLPHRSLIDYVAWTTARFDLREGDRVMQLSPFSYDISLWETVWPLTVGASVVLVPEDKRIDSAFIVREAALRQVTHIHLTPPLLRHVIRERSLRYCGRLRVILISSDVLPADLLNEALRAAGPDRRLFHIYGVTEVSVESTAWECTPLVDGDRPRIGSPVTGTTIHLLDEDMQAVGPGEVGEIYISSPGLAIGYHGLGAATAAAFIPDPFSGCPGARMYRTRDRARRLDDGIVLLGRADRHVKIRGHLADLDVVEAALARHPSVETAIAVMNASDQLDVYLLPVVGRELGYRDIADYASSELTGVSVPNRYFVITDIPQTWNGKIDRRNLAGITFQQLRREDVPTASARDELEELLRAVMAEVLGDNHFGVASDFFEAGGHSLMAMAIAERLYAEHGVRVQLPAFFRHRNVRAMISAGAVEEAKGQARKAVSRAEVHPLSAQQVSVWLAQQQLPLSPIYNTIVAFRTPRSVDPARMWRTMRALLVRQEMLRMRIEPTANGPRQRIDSIEAAQADLLEVFECESVQEEQAWVRRALHRPFDLGRQWPSRALLLRGGARGDVVVVVLHHVATDGLSARILIEEIASLYEADHSDLGQVPLLAYGYIDFIGDGGDERAAQREWWQHHLAGAPPLTLPGPGTRREVQTREAATVSLQVPGALAGAFQRLAAEFGTTTFTVFHAFAVAYFSRVCDERDVVVAVPMSIRPPEAEHVVGHFIQTILTRVHVDDDIDVARLIGHSGTELAETFARSAVSTADLAAGWDSGGTPVTGLLRVLVGVDDRKGWPPFGGAPVEFIDIETEARDYDIELNMVRFDDELRVELSYDRDLFDDRWAHGFLGRFLAFAERLAANPQARPRDVDVLTVQDHSAIALANATEHPVQDCCVMCTVAAVSEAHPSGIALADSTGYDSYKSLQAKIESAASVLRSAGLTTGQIVAVHVGRSRASLVTMLAVMLAGGVYLPLRNGIPARRLSGLLSNAGAHLKINCVDDADLASIDPAPGWIDLTGSRLGELPPGPGFTADAGVHGDRAAYLLFTSGTTGQPNGVLVSHRSLINRLAWSREHFGFGPDDTHVQKTALDFDVALAEIFQPLVSGGTLILPPTGVEQDPARLAAEFVAARATVVHFVPSALRAYISSRQRLPSSVRLVMCSGEGLPNALAREVLDAHPGLVVENLYGPTEAAIEVAASRAEGGRAAGFVPTGRAIWNTVTEVLDENLRRVAPYRPGELYIGGYPVSAGYLGRPGLTARKFVPDPYSPVPGARMYATGDRVFHDADGILHFLGRADRQVKVRGARVELGAVEALLASVPGVRACAVIVEMRDGLADAMAAYVETDGTPVSRIRARLAENAPRHLIPDRIVEVERIPLTASGKLDHRTTAALAAQHDQVGGDTGSSGAAGRVRAVQAAFADLLDRESVGPDDDFFDLGGHSLTAARAAARLSAEFGVTVSSTALFDSPTPRELARSLHAKDHRPEAPAAGSGSGEEFPLSQAQLRLWIADTASDDSHDNDVAVGWVFPQLADGEALAGAFRKVIDRHDILRTGFRLTDDGPRQVVHPRWQPDILRIDDSSVDADSHGVSLLRRLRAKPFDLAGEPCLTVAVGMSADGAVGVVNVHHILMDGWSIPLLLADLQRSLSGKPAAAAPQYAEYVVAEAALSPEDLEVGLRYWQEHLRGAAELTLPGPAPKNPLPGGGARKIELPGELVARLLEQARHAGGTLYSGLYAAFAATLYCMTRQQDILIGADAANRLTSREQEMIGFFVNHLPLRIQVTKGDSPQELLRRSGRIIIDGLRNQNIPFDRIVELSNPVRRPGRTPLLRALLVLQNLPAGEDLAGEVRELVELDDYADSSVDLQLVLAPGPAGLTGALEFALDTVTHATAGRLVEIYRICAEALAGDSAAITLGGLASRIDSSARERARQTRQLRRA